MRSRSRDERGIALPSPVAALSLGAVLLAGIAFFTTSGSADEPAEAAPRVAATPTPTPTRTAPEPVIEEKPKPEKKKPAVRRGDAVRREAGDAVAAVTGKRWGRHRYPGGKSVEGSAAFFAVAFGIAWAAMVAGGPDGAAALGPAAVAGRAALAAAGIVCSSTSSSTCRIRRVIASGGGTNHALWLELMADGFERPIYQTRSVEAA